MNWMEEIKIEDLPEQEQQFALSFGLNKTLRFIKNHGKQKIYLKGIDSIINNKKKKYIVENFNGHNHNKLAHDTKFSLRYIYKILDEKRKI